MYGYESIFFVFQPYMSGKRFFDRNIRIWYTYKSGCTRRLTARGQAAGNGVRTGCHPLAGM